MPSSLAGFQSSLDWRSSPTRESIRILWFFYRIKEAQAKTAPVYSWHFPRPTWYKYLRLHSNLPSSCNKCVTCVSIHQWSCKKLESALPKTPSFARNRLNHQLGSPSCPAISWSEIRSSTYAQMNCQDYHYLSTPSFLQFSIRHYCTTYSIIALNMHYDIHIMKSIAQVR